ncbi:MAG: carboxypeptidase regulatory-like domain-containing protein [Candidatus Levybacteria bacterium]|nr:carboxypeptidase regulatory-like domain-containing protein [Candidatus Levybacteria bacterium]
MSIKSFSIVKLFFVIAMLFLLFQNCPVLATTTISETEDPVKVSARIGEFYLNLSGFASPFASIILTSNGVFYRSTVADQNGFWAFKDILINRNFSSFCLQHIDYKNIGESTTCLSIPAANNNIDKKNIFLPPTIGLQRSQITAGGNAVVFGYTMPGATVTIHLQDGTTYTVVADKDGYYELTLKNLKAGVYELYATAVYDGKSSENPSNTVKLVALSWLGQLLQWLKDFFRWLWNVLTGFGLGPLWIILPLIPLIVYLLLKLWPEKFTFVYNNKMYLFFHPERKKLHHSWFVGY